MKNIMNAVLFASGMIAINAYASGTTNLRPYGLLDVGVLRVDGLGTSSNLKALQVGNNIVNTSHIGLIGTSDVMTGHKFGFRLEGNVGLTDGSQINIASNGAQSTLFSREASVFYQTGLGTLTLGRQKNPFLTVPIAGDARGWANIGTANIMLSDASSFGGSATAKTGLASLTGGSFTNSLIKYDSPVWNGFSLTAYHAPGGLAGDVDSASVYGGHARYNSKSLTISAGTRWAYGRTVSPTRTAEADSLGAMYTLNKFRVGASVTYMKNPSVASNASNSSFNVKLLTAGYTVNPRLDFSVGRYVLEDEVSSSNGSTINGAGAIYKLSNSTSLYAQYARSNNKGTSGMAAYGYGFANNNSLSGGQATFPSVMNSSGTTQTAIAMGIQHRF